MNNTQTITEITIPSRITHSQFGCSLKVWNAHVKDKKLRVKGFSPDGQFAILDVAGEDYRAHTDILMSDEDYREAKHQERSKAA